MEEDSDSRMLIPMIYQCSGRRAPEWIVEVGCPSSRLWPGVLRISQEHSLQMTAAGAVVVVFVPCMQNTEVVNELDITLLTSELVLILGCKPLYEFDSLSLFLGYRSCSPGPWN